MKKIFFLRTAPYRYFLDGMDLYDSFNAVSTRKVDTSIITIAKALMPFSMKDIPHIFCSPAKRSIETAQLVSQHPRILPELYEVHYSMTNFIRKKDFYRSEQPEVTKARKAFVNAFITNKLEESYEKVIKRLEKVLKILSVQQEDSIVFSHGFFLKILEAYIRDRSIKSHPKRLLKYFSGETETFHFLEGFMVEHSGEKYQFEKYIRNGGVE